MHGDYSGLCTEVTVDCARRLQWIVHGDYSGLCTEITVDCARRLQCGSSAETGLKWTISRDEKGPSAEMKRDHQPR